LSRCVIVEYKYGQSDDDDDDDNDDDEKDGPVGLPSGVYGRAVTHKHYMSFNSLDNLENVSIGVGRF